MSRRAIAGGGIGVVGCAIIYVLIALAIGGISVQFALFGLLGLSVPLLACMLVALIPAVGQIAIVIAAVLWLLQLGGVVLPLFHVG